LTLPIEMGDASKKHDPLFNSTMSLGDHLDELRTRLLYALAGVAVCAIIGFFLGRRIIAFLEGPYVDAMGEEARLIALGPADGFISYVKIALVTGLILSSPWVFYHLWMFIAAGLYPNEKKYVYIAAPFSAALFVAGALFFIVVVGPLTLGFLVRINNFISLSSQFSFRLYIAFVTHLMLVFGIAFQTPTAIFFLNRAGLVSLEALSRSRKYVVLLIVIVAAMATPPDVVSQIALAVPLYLLFELGILLSYFASRKSKSSS
jgi:sec-independent protein translocase protein TatC